MVSALQSTARGAFLCLVPPPPRLPGRGRAARTAAAAATLFHAIVLAAIVALPARPGSFAPPPPQARSGADALQLPRMVFFDVPGKGGGGGGGGRTAAPPARAKESARDRVAIAATRPVTARGPAREPRRAPEVVLLDAVPLAAAELLMGLPESPGLPSFSEGPVSGRGSGGGSGGGSGTGVGSGTGPGIGPGTGGGFGGGAYRLGGGVVPPALLTQVQPKYTPEAVVHKIQGTVTLEVVVGRSGVPLDIRVIRSLDRNGLDEEAVKAVRQWRFTPGRVGGMPVDVIVIVLMDFRLS